MRSTAILMLTARDTPPDRIQGLDAGADDYLVKPFDFGELVAGVLGSNVIDVKLSRLRAKLVNSGVRILTVRGAGFRLEEA